jgi:hypothetical protein
MPVRRKLDLPIAPLRAFVAIGTYGSFRKAAEALNLTSPAISAHQEPRAHRGWQAICPQAHRA